MALSYSGEVALRSAHADQFSVKAGADGASKATVRGDATQTANTVLTLPPQSGRLATNPESGTMEILRNEIANSALLQVGSALVDDGGQLKVHSNLADETRFSVSDTAVSTSLPSEAPELHIVHGSDRFRLSVVDGSLVVQHSLDDGETWSDAIQAWTPDPAP